MPRGGKTPAPNQETPAAEGVTLGEMTQTGRSPKEEIPSAIKGDHCEVEKRDRQIKKEDIQKRRE